MDNDNYCVFIWAGMVIAQKVGNDLKLIEITINEKLNVKELDKHHMEIAGIVNNIFTCFSINNKQEVKSNLKMLTALLREHFDLEERLMKETKFNGYISHKLEHDRFYNKIMLLSNTFSIGNESLSSEFFENIKLWFFNHIEINDKKCGAHFVQQGIK